MLIHAATAQLKRRRPRSPTYLRGSKYTHPSLESYRQHTHLRFRNLWLTSQQSYVAIRTSRVQHRSSTITSKRLSRRTSNGCMLIPRCTIPSLPAKPSGAASVPTASVTTILPRAARRLCQLLLHCLYGELHQLCWELLRVAPLVQLH